MIFQFYHLLPELTTLENVLVAADDCPRRLELFSAIAASIAPGPRNCWRWSA